MDGGVGPCAPALVVTWRAQAAWVEIDAHSACLSPVFRWSVWPTGVCGDGCKNEDFYDRWAITLTGGGPVEGYASIVACTRSTDASAARVELVVPPGVQTLEVQTELTEM